MPKKQSDEFTEQESMRRFEAALRGAFKTPATPLKTVSPKRRKTKSKRRSKSAAPA